MSTNVKYARPVNPASPAAQRRREIRRRNRNIRMILFAILICIVVILSICYARSVQALNKQIADLNAQVAQLTDENHVFSTALQDYERTVRMFVDDNEVKAAPVTIYKIPLSDALQEYTYNLCVDYYIPEHYELILAMMWHESNYTADVISRTNDYGLMQINKTNHDWLSEELGIEDFLDPHQNIHAGVYMIAKLIHKYGDTSKALMAYNMGERGAANYWATGTYSTAYSNSIIAKQAAIKTDDYRN